MNEISPVFVFSTGRCGSTMVSEMLNRHPGILSMSEFFSALDLDAFPGKKVTGDSIGQGDRQNISDIVGPVAQESHCIS